MSNFPGFVGGSYEAPSLPADAQQSINLYPEVVSSGNGRAPSMLLGRPGYHTFCTLSGAPVRGLWAGDNRLFAAGGANLYEIFGDGSVNNRGNIGTDADNTPVEMFPNGTQLFVVSAGVALCDSGGGPAACLFNDGSAVTARTGAFLDTFFIANPPDTKQIFISASNDGTSWDPTDVATKEGYPDNISALLADHEELYLLGKETVEAWRNEGGADFPFVRDPGAFNHEGLAATWAPTRLAGSLFLLAGDARGRILAYQLQGFQPRRISTHAIETIWSKYTTVADAYGYGYVLNGHQFWVINFLTANATWVYDVSTGYWHRRAWWDGAALQKDRGRCHAAVDIGNGLQHFVGDWENGKIYVMSSSFTDDFGGDIQYVRSSPYVSGVDNARVFSSRLQLDLETGNGALSVDLNTSDDFTKTWSTTRTVSAGSTGDYTKRVLWRRLGASRHRVYRVTITTQEKIAITGAWLRAGGEI